MNPTIIIWCILCLLLDFLSIKKLKNREDLNIFDFIGLFHSLYFVLIPIKSALGHTYYWGELFVDTFNKSGVVLEAIFVFKLLITLLNYYYCRHKEKRHREKISYINITRYIRNWDSQIHFCDKYIIPLAILLVISILPLMYAGGETIEQESGREVQMPSMNPLLARFLFCVRLMLPALIVMVYKYSKNNVRHTRFAKYALIAGLVSCVFGSKGDFFFIAIAVLVYAYSVERHLFTLKNIVLYGSVLLLIVIVLFPALQLFREYKTLVFETNQNLSLFDALFGLFRSNENIQDLFETANTVTDARSLNVFMGLHDAMLSDYTHTNGMILLDNLKTIIPVFRLSPEYNEIYSAVLMGSSKQDIAESILMCQIFDMGYIGVFIAPLVFLIFFNCIYAEYTVCYRIFKVKELRIFLTYTILYWCCNVEHYLVFRYIWDPLAVVFFLFSLIILCIRRI